MRAGTVRPTTLSFKMENLAKNGMYYFRIYAENMIGQSQPLQNEAPIEAKPAHSKINSR